MPPANAHVRWAEAKFLAPSIRVSYDESRNLVLAPRPFPRPEQAASPTYRFGTFEVNAASRQLSKAGRELHLQEQPGRLLLVLLEKPGELRTREELQKKLWPNETFVEFDDGLNTAIQKIRQVLGDEARNPRFVETVPRQGYRFIAPVQVILPETSEPEPEAVVSELAPMPVPESRRLPDWRISAVAAALLGLAAGWWWARKPEAAFQTMLLTIAAPPGVELRHGIRGGSAISPDGTTVVFAGSRNGRSMLWLRSLKSLQARELPGTEAGALPFWSPDGKSIGFQAGGKIRRLDLPDGPVIELANASRPTRGGWSSDGSILFASGSGGPLLRVRSTGGAPTALAHTEGARWPSPLPGGGRFLFHEDAGRRILMSSLEASDQPAPLFAAESSAVYAPPHGGHPGKLLWMKGTALVAQTFDPQSGRLSGDVVPVIEDAGYADRWRMVDVTASMNGMLLIGAGNTMPSRLAWYKRDGTRLEAVGEPEWLRTVRLTPDGRKAVVEQGIPRALWLHDFESGVTSRATFEPELSGWPVWSPDGKEIAYSGERNGRVALYARNAKGGGAERKLISREFDDFLYDWSRDGSHLIYTEVNARTKLDLWVLPLGGAPRPFRSTPFNEDWPQFSPDGRWVAYVSDESGRNEVYVTSFPNAEKKWQISTAGGITPRWCANGELFFESASGQIMTAATRPSPRQFEWAAPRALFRNPSPGRHYDVTPKGDRLLMIAPVEDSTARNQLTVIVNWQAGLPR